MMSATFFWKGVELLGGRWSGSAVREYALELLELGWTAKQAACLLGYDRCSVTGWEECLSGEEGFPLSWSEKGQNGSVAIALYLSSNS